MVQRWLYDAAGRIVAELDAGNDLVASYAYLQDGHVPFLMRRAGTTYRLVTDSVGSVRLVIDTSDGSVVQRIDYDPFGVPEYVGPEPAGFVPFGFAGGHYDPATGLVRMGARDYDPATGRFTAKDPLGFGGGYASLYSYVGGDAVNSADPSGLGPSTQNSRSGGGGGPPIGGGFGMRGRPGPAPVRDPSGILGAVTGGPIPGSGGLVGGGGGPRIGGGFGMRGRPGPAPVRDPSGILGAVTGGPIPGSGGLVGGGGGPPIGGGFGMMGRPGPAPVRDPSGILGAVTGGPIPGSGGLVGGGGGPPIGGGFGMMVGRVPLRSRSSPVRQSRAAIGGPGLAGGGPASAGRHRGPERLPA